MSLHVAVFAIETAAVIVIAIAAEDEGDVVEGSGPTAGPTIDPRLCWSVGIDPHHNDDGSTC